MMLFINALHVLFRKM